MDKLSKMFGSAGQVKIMRLFLFNPGTVFSGPEIAKRAGVRLDSSRKVVRVLEKSGLIKKRVIFSQTSNKGNKKKKALKKKIQGWVLDESSQYVGALRNLLLPAEALSDNQIEKKFRKTGRVKLLVISGAFLHNEESRVDVFLVADSMKSNGLSSAMKELEAQIGTELRYAVLEPDEFIYRMNIRDKLIRDIFDYPHRIILDKIGIVVG